METMYVVIDESSDSGFEKVSEEFPKEVLPLELKEVQEIVEQEPASPSTPILQVLWKILQIYPLHQILNLIKRKDLLPGLS